MSGKYKFSFSPSLISFPNAITARLLPKTMQRLAYNTETHSPINEAMTASWREWVQDNLHEARTGRVYVPIQGIRPPYLSELNSASPQISSHCPHFIMNESTETIWSWWLPRASPIFRATAGSIGPWILRSRSCVSTGKLRPSLTVTGASG